ncbi:DUF5076 domain-containing protein [Brevundimonas sp.]|uniref:DUF5076 domain-containing protein n=1 Tax=Brevundimonas sp. TaxID=1871086 RepID=UPI002D31888E|nr:DUF5076 domain-containing protein [Brevundimonas sp.]HYC74748.1 DUF5076 domain-containing protein [Brevundimonas sp.]
MTEPADHQLKTPASVAADPDAIEVLRMWWSNREPVMSIKPAFSDPAMFGRMLAYAATHMAHGYKVRHGMDERAAYNQILTGMSDALKAQNVQTVVETADETGSVQ